jgi:hypothetical protein
MELKSKCVIGRKKRQSTIGMKEFLSMLLEAWKNKGELSPGQRDAAGGKSSMALWQGAAKSRDSKTCIGMISFFSSGKGIQELFINLGGPVR